jgi:phage/plasmid-associated DNA primase
MKDARLMKANQWADFWYYKVGVNVIPANNVHENKEYRKKPFWTDANGKQNWIKWSEYQTEPISLEQFEFWKNNNAFENGLAIVCGKVYRGNNKGMWLNAIDCDNKAGVEAMCPSGVAHTAKGTLVEQHGNPDKCHILLYSDEPLLNRQTDASSEAQIEIKSMGKNILYCSGGFHQDGSLIDIVNTEQIKIVYKDSIEKVLDEYLGTAKTFDAVTTSTTSELTSLNEGDNRQGVILEKLGKYFAKIPKEEITEQDCINKALTLNAELGTSYDESRVVKLGKDFFKYRMSDEEVDVKTMGWGLAVKSCIFDKRMVVPSVIYKEILTTTKVKKEDYKSLRDYIKAKFEDLDYVPTIQKNSFEHGLSKTPILFEKEQIHEVAEYLKGSDYVKRVELSGSLISYDGECYTNDSEVLLQRNATKLLVKCTDKSVNEIVKYHKRSCDIITQAEIEKHAHLKCLKNGTFNVKTGVFKPEFSPENIILNQIPRNYDKSKSWDTIKKHVTEIIPDEKDRQSFYDYLSLGLMPYNGIEFLLFVHGLGGSGKGQLADLAELVYGDDNVENATLQTISSDATVRKDIAYKMLNIDTDMKHDVTPELSIVKKIGTQDKMTDRSIYEHGTKYRPSFRYASMTNALFEMPDDRDAEPIYDRSHIIKLHKRFRGTADEIKNVFKIIPNLEDELDAFMTYLCDNAKWIHNNQKIHFYQDASTTKKLWNQVGNQIKKFSSIWIEHGSKNKVPSTDVYQSWLDYAKENNLTDGGRNTFQETFGKINAVTATAIRISPTETFWGYQGIRLRTKEEVDKLAGHVETPKEELIRLVKEMPDSEDLRITQAIDILENR